MTTQSLPSRRHNRAQSNKQCFAAVCLMAVALLLGPIMMPAPADADVLTDAFSSKTARLLICVLTWGQECYLSEEVIGTGEPVSPFPVTCEKPLMTGLPQFLTWPKGQARYRFQENCFSPARPGSVMTVRWEGSWNPSETKADRPNASETVEITGFEPFLPGRAPGGKIYMYWTARCTRDPWLQSGGCTLWGAYVPDELRQAFPDIDWQNFPRTGSIISPSDKQRLYAEYLRVNPPYFSQMEKSYADYLNPPVAKKFNPAASKFISPQHSSQIQQTAPSPSSLVTQPSAVPQTSPLPSPSVMQAPPPSSSAPTPMKRSSSMIMPRGVEPEGNQAAGEAPSVSETDSDQVEAPVTITFDLPLHFRSVEGDDTVLPAGSYEIESVMDLQLSLTQEEQASVLLPATAGTHRESLTHSMAIVLSGESNDVRHLVFMTPDGKRLEATGSTSGVTSRGPGEAALLIPERKLRDGILATSAFPKSLPPPPCYPSQLPIGPRWLPVPCTMPALPIPPPTPYVDNSNILHACVNNITGAFRIAQAAEECLAVDNWVKVKWQLVP